MKNENLGFHFCSDESGDDDRRQSSVLELLVTSADKAEVQSKWKVKMEPNLNSEDHQLTEVMLKLQKLELIIDFELLAHFMGIFRTDGSPEVEAPEKFRTVNDFPLLDFQSKGLKIFIPLSGVHKDCDCYILAINSITMVEPDNKIDRKPLRPDIYHKALQLGILDIYGTKVENRQYEILFSGISLSTGNWVAVLDGVFKQRLPIYHENPAVEWNKKGSPLANRTELLVTTIFKDFSLGIVYAPNIVFDNVLVCEEAIEFNCTNDMAFNMNLNQLILAAQLADAYDILMRTLAPKAILVYSTASSEFIEVNSNLFQTSPSPKKEVISEADELMVSPYKILDIWRP